MDLEFKSRQPAGRLAFTLLELLLAITLVALLSILAISGISAMRTASFKTKDLNNLRNIGMACQAYAGDHGGRFPLKYDYNITVSSQRQWDGNLVAGNYLTKEALASPADKIQRTVAGNIRSYKYNGYFGDSKKEQDNTVEGNVSRITKPLSDIILAANGGGSGSVIGANASSGAYQHSNCTLLYGGKGANFVFLDLHAEWMTDSGGYDPGDNKTLWYKHWRPDSAN